MSIVPGSVKVGDQPIKVLISADYLTSQIALADVKLIAVDSYVAGDDCCAGDAAIR